MIAVLLENPLLLLFLVLGIGFLVGRVEVGGFSLGISAVLFVGLGFGALHPDMRLPDFVYLFGLILFVYTVGLNAGPGFLATFRRGGAKDNALVVGVLTMAFGLTVAAAKLFDIGGSFAAGVFTGALTNTPALAAVLQYQTDTAAASDLDRLLAEPVVGYSVAYPFGVLGMVAAVYLLRRLRPPGSARDSSAAANPEDLVRVTVNVDHADFSGLTVAELIRETGWRVLFTRIRPAGGEVSVPEGSTVLARCDLVTVVGESADVAAATDALGSPAEEDLSSDRSDIDFRRVFVSNNDPVGRRISDLDLYRRFGAIVTRVRRGDVDHMARADMVLEPGDRIRVVAPADRLGDVSTYFGDSFRRLSEIDVASFSLGLVLGLMLGLVPFPLPGGTTFTLGPAGGPLVVGLVLGALGQTGPVTWQLPYNASLTLRQLGAVMFLAGVGTRSGYAFVETLSDGAGLSLLGVGALVTFVSAAAGRAGGVWVRESPTGVLAGTVAGLVTQPAVLAFASQQVGDEQPNLGYATVYPVATLTKILLAQTLVSILS